ncbi:MAG: sulfatase-like hydrolase/transferase [Proteobacteria bacterium]|nr:sulfatase-like hydrolase/transferase [Pseudomonadota bacterium]MCP4920937.1 sulfatase-like hydrolase/transferase [Pseudomonadota bacterium]
MILLWLACGAEPEPVAPPVVEAPPPDVLFIVVDTLRADRLGSYGHERPTSPFMDQLAAEGVRFSDATMPATWTWPGHGALFTGEPPWINGAHHSEEEGVQNTGARKAVRGIRDEVPTLAERFSDIGYATFALAGNALLAPSAGLIRGFQFVQAPHPDEKLVELVGTVTRIEKDPRPVLLFVNLMAAHSPYQRPDVPWISETERTWWDEGAGPEWLRPFQRAQAGERVLATNKTPGFGPDFAKDGVVQHLPPEGVDLIGRVYDSGVREADGHVEQIVTTFRAASPDGIVVLTSDHGEYLGEHDLLVHHSTTYRPVTWVPLIVSWPGHLEPAVIDTPISVERIGPTLLELVGGTEGIDRSLIPVMEGREEAQPIQAKAWVDEHRSRTYGGIFSFQWSQYRIGDLAYVFSSGGHQELYDLETDPLMLVDIAATHADDVARLEAASEGQFEGQSGAAVGGDMDEALKALGYVD